MERVKKLAALVLLITLISFCTSAIVFSLMRKNALEKMLTMQEMMVLQSLNASTSAVRNLTRARFQEAEETLYSSLGLNMTFLKQIYDQRGTMPGQTVSLIINNVSKYRTSSPLSRDKNFDQYFKPDVIDFMRGVEKAGHEAK